MKVVDYPFEHYSSEFELPASRTAEPSVRLIDEKIVSPIHLRLYQRLFIRALCAQSSKEETWWLVSGQRATVISTEPVPKRFPVVASVRGQ